MKKLLIPKQRWVLRNYDLRNKAVRYLTELDVDNIEMQELILRPHKKSRSREQNDMFHAWCGAIGKATGHSKAEIKEILVESTFGVEEYLNLKGEKRSRVRATSDMNTEEMSELIERTIQIGTEYGAEAPEITYGT
tara:strand:- start:36 stop:443 length:408 start_codon:yes stop_codon:yes gene_type:complete